MVANLVEETMEELNHEGVKSISWAEFKSFLNKN